MPAAAPRRLSCRLALVRDDEPTPVRPGRARGVYLEEDAPPGTVVVLVYDSRRERINRAELAERVYTSATRLAFVQWLNAVDPTDQQRDSRRGA